MNQLTAVCAIEPYGNHGFATMVRAQGAAEPYFLWKWYEREESAFEDAQKLGFADLRERVVHSSGLSASKRDLWVLKPEALVDPDQLIRFGFVTPTAGEMTFMPCCPTQGER